jgi:hypothetical protein
MVYEVPSDLLELVRRMDQLGREGKTQEEIAAAVGADTRANLRNRLLTNGFLWESENRVRLALTKERLEDVLAANRVQPVEAVQ